MYKQEIEIKPLGGYGLYAAHHLNSNVRASTTSGGIGYALAKAEKDNDGLICGAAYKTTNHEVQHIVCKSEEEINRLKGSKYLQSANALAFREILLYLQKSRKNTAIVFGTPCQIAGLSKVLTIKRVRKQVILVDLFCHGVPSYLIWKKYLEFLETKGIQKGSIEEVRFRDKQYSWHQYYMHIKSVQKEYVKAKEDDPFLKLFTMGVLNQKACFTCQYRNSSAADIRLGDYWGERFRNSEAGHSMVAVQTEQGAALLKQIPTIEWTQVPVKERYAQQTQDHTIPKYYEESFQMIKRGCHLFKIRNLYESRWVRVKRKIKRTGKRFRKFAKK